MRPNLHARFWSKVEIGEAGKCWDWRTTRDRYGYGKFFMKGRTLTAPRVAYALVNGGIPDGLWVLHKCDNRACCNPTHLFLGTHRDNMRDMMKKGRHKSANSRNKVTQCKWGHPFSPENTYLKPRERRGRSYNERVCIACDRERNRKWRLQASQLSDLKVVKAGDTQAREETTRTAC